MKLKKVLMGLITTVCTTGLAIAADSKNIYKKDKEHPFDAYPFKVPESYQDSMAYYRKWARLTGFEYSGLHWGQFIVIYTNTGKPIYKDNYFEYLKHFQDYDDEDEDEDEDVETPVVNFKEYQVGTLFVKENYASEAGSPGQPLTLTTMIKREKGYDPKYGDWQYIQSDVKGNIILDGKMSNPVLKKLCIDCHANMAERDYIFSTFFSSQKSDE